MERTLISAIFADPKSFDKVQVTVGGWIRTMRAQKAFGFIELNDGTYFKSLQVVFEKEILDNYDDIARQNVGAALVVKGTLVYTPEAKQPIELKAAVIEVEGASTPDYPLQKKRHSLEYLRTIAHLRPRTNRRHTPSTGSSRSRASSTSTPPSSPPRTARARGRCSR